MDPRLKIVQGQICQQNISVRLIAILPQAYVSSAIYCRTNVNRCILY